MTTPPPPRRRTQKPGWYPAPNHNAMEQYWDGAQWTGEPRWRPPTSKFQRWKKRNELGLALLLALAVVIFLVVVHSLNK